MHRLPDINQIAAFIAVAEELSFKRAAARLAIDASALSRRIRDLEARLGFQLFFRTTQVVELTEAGRRFYDGNQHLIGALRETIASAARVARGSVGHLRVAYMTFAGLDLMPRAVTRYRKMHPDVSLSLSYLPTQDQKVALSRNEIDVGLMLGPFQHSEFEVETLMVDSLFLAMPVDHKFASMRSIAPERLEGQPIVLGTDRHWDFYRSRIEQALGPHAIALNIELEASNMLGMLGLVKAGAGLTIVPESMTGYCPGGVVMRPIAGCEAAIETIAAWPKPAEAKLRDFVSILREQSARR